MGSDFELVVVCDQASHANHFLQAAIDEIKRIENLLSEFKADSETSLINAHAGINPVSVSVEVFQLIKRSVSISHLTQGAFDITMAPLKKIYQFRNAEFQLPNDSVIQSCLKLT
ncbi:MAG: FAD:protein FMN transferase, partial [Chitinophagaceae bacterium]